MSNHYDVINSHLNGANVKSLMLVFLKYENDSTYSIQLSVYLVKNGSNISNRVCKTLCKYQEISMKSKFFDVRFLQEFLLKYGFR